MKKANHICKYSKCTLGADGGRKEYYACDYCDRINAWKSLACCKEHYDLYIQEVLEERSKANKLPERIDKTEEEVKEIFEKPVEQVLEETKAELSEYSVDGEVDIDSAIDQINKEISEKKPRKTRKGRN